MTHKKSDGSFGGVPAAGYGDKLLAGDSTTVRLAMVALEALSKDLGADANDSAPP
jgi:hypothetical protein